MEPREPWQWIVQLGRNSATYKLALADQLLKWADEGIDRVPMDELAADFLDAYEDRVRDGRPQLHISGRWTVVERAILEDEPHYRALRKTRKRALEDMVLQKFHNLTGNVEAPRFFEDPEGDELILTDRLMKLAEPGVDPLRQEAQSRWDLLEHAFTPEDPEPVIANELLSEVTTRESRKDLTHLIPTLSGYQRDRCFYCGQRLEDPVVDHVLPYSLVRHNQIWNLVLADDHCNANKADRLPTGAMIDRLIDRNEAIIRSDHPLKESLFEDLGETKTSREETVKREYKRCRKMSPRVWGGAKDDADTMIRSYMRYVQERGDS